MYLELGQLNENPWRFRIVSDKDFENLSNHIKENGFDAVNPPTVAKIEKKFFVVDGHIRIDAARQSGLNKIPCQVTTSVKTFQDLRVLSYKLNRDGYSNPLPLSDMFYEDLKMVNDHTKLAEIYGVTIEYIESLLKIRELHDDSKVVIQKAIMVAKRKYQSLLEQLTPAHLANLADLPREKQLTVVDWIFRDIMYGPPDESMVSIPSIYELVDEITKVTQLKENQTYDKKDTEKNKLKRIEFVCKCGTKYDIDTKSKTVFEYLEQNNIIIKKEFQMVNNAVKIFSSKSYTKSELKTLIDKSADEDINVVFSRVHN